MPTSILHRPSPDEYAPYYAAYISRVPAGNLVELYRAQIPELEALLRPVDEARSRSSYATGKWTVREVVGHLIDTERVFAYRALAFARGDVHPLPSFDQALWNPAGHFDERPLDALLAEWSATRTATIALLEGLPAEALSRRGVASELSFTVNALLHIPLGHVTYHEELLRRLYFA